jgi:chorismate mutase/prephenate dehydrogenase
LNIAFFTALAESGEDAPRLSEVSSTTFARQKALAQAVAAENPRLYFEIQSLNEFGDTALSSLQSSIERLRSVIRGRDEETFVRIMTKGLSYLSPSSTD